MHEGPVVRTFAGIDFVCHQLVTLQRVAEFENKLGLSLPVDYFQFLLQTNGHSTKQRSYVAIPDEQVTICDKFLGLDRDRLNIEFWMNEFAGAIPTGYIPIAFDPGGGVFLLALSHQAGTAYYYDRGMDFPNSDEDGNTYWVANSFTEFLQRFKATPKEAEADLSIPVPLAAQVASIWPEPPTKVKRERLRAPKGKTLAARLKNLVGIFPWDELNENREAMELGFEILSRLDEWGEREEQFLNERVDRYLAEDADLRSAVQADPQMLLLYLFLSGYTRGQLRVGSLPMKEFAESPTTIRDAVLSAKR